MLSMKSLGSAAVLSLALSPSLQVRAQTDFNCTLGRVRERVAPQYPMQLEGRPMEGVVTLLATFAPNGKVTGSKVLAGPQQLRFETESYIRGWTAEASNDIRQCAISVEYRLDRPQSVCSARNDTHLRAEREDDSHVLMHLSCDNW